MPNIPGWEPLGRPRRVRVPTTPTGLVMVAHFINPDQVLAVEDEAVSLHHTQGGCTWCEVIAKTARTLERKRLREAVLDMPRHDRYYVESFDVLDLLAEPQP